MMQALVIKMPEVAKVRISYKNVLMADSNMFA